MTSTLTRDRSGEDVNKEGKSMKKQAEFYVMYTGARE